MLVGREPELGILNAHLEKMLAGNGSVLFLTGEAGLGKTTLVHEWHSLRQKEKGKRQNLDHRQNAEHRQAADDDDFAFGLFPFAFFLEAACSIPIGNVDVGRLEALQPWADVIAQLESREYNSGAGTHGSAPLQKINLKKLIHDAAPAWAWALPFVGDIAHAALETSRLVKEQRGEFERTPSTQNQQQVFQQYVNLLTKISADIPLVIFLDDLHWADTSSCNLLFYLSRQITDKKILVIATYRQDDAAQANDGKGHAIVTIRNEILRYKTGTEFTLSYLDTEAIENILQKAYPASSSREPRTDSKGFVHWLHKISDGNSLFVTQFIETLKEDGHLNERGEFTGDYRTVTIPRSALAVVEERARRLDSELRELLMYATAEGEEFTAYVLERLTDRTPMALLKDLRRASTHGVITERGVARAFANQTTAVYGFSHALFHKALYDALSEAERYALHQKCFELLHAEWERRAASELRTTTLATKLLTHAERSEEWAVVADVALSTARQLWDSWNGPEALAMIDRVVPACRSLGDAALSTRAEAIFLRGIIFSSRGRYDDALADFIECERSFRALGENGRAIESILWAAGAHQGRSRHEEMGSTAKRGLLEARAIGDTRLEAWALHSIAIMNTLRGDYAQAAEYVAASRAIYAATGLDREEGNVINTLGVVYKETGRYPEALECFTEGYTKAEARGDRWSTGNSLCNMGIAHSHMGHDEEALALQKRALEIFRPIGHSNGEANATNAMANIYYLRNELEQALEEYGKALSIYERIGARIGAAHVVGNIGSVYHKQGKLADALQCSERYMELCQEIGNRSMIAAALVNLASVLVSTGDLAAAEQALQRSEPIASELTLLHVLAQIQRERALLLAKRGEHVAARDTMQRAAQMFRDLKQDGNVRECEEHLANLSRKAQ